MHDPWSVLLENHNIYLVRLTPSLVKVDGNVKIIFENFSDILISTDVDSRFKNFRNQTLLIKVIYISTTE